MDVDHTLRQRFEAIADRIQEEIRGHLRDAADELAIAVASERTAAVAEGNLTTRHALEQEHQQQLGAAMAAGELQIARARDEGWQEGRDVGKLEGIEIGHAQAAEQATEEGRKTERQAAHAARARLAQGIRAIDAGRSLSEILTTLVDVAAAEDTRAALLLVHADRLRWWDSVGLDRPTDEALEAYAAAGRGIFSEAINGCVPVLMAGDSERRPLLFTASPSAAELLAVPISLGGQVVALLYTERCVGVGADAEGRDGSWAASVEILAHHASRALEAVTLLRTAQVLSHSTLSRPLIGGPPSSSSDEARSGAAG